MTKPYAFFDVDGTLLRIKSMFSFHDFWYRRWKELNDEAFVEEHKDVTAILRALTESDTPRELINRRYYEFFSGRSVDEVASCALAWTRHVTADPRLFITEVTEELESLRTKGVEPVFVSGSFVEILEPIAEREGEAADCWAFGDDISDLPMLSAVGHPVAVIGDSALGTVARDRGWRCLHLSASDEQTLIRSNLSALVGATM